jgi:hypothetical protein
LSPFEELLDPELDDLGAVPNRAQVGIDPPHHLF